MSNKQIDNLAIDVGKILLGRIKQIGKSDELLITYGDVAKKLPYEFNPENLNYPLGDLSTFCRELGLPLISTIVVNQEERMPGPGYYKTFFPGVKGEQRIDVFLEQFNRVKACQDWMPLAQKLGLK